MTTALLLIIFWCSVGFILYPWLLFPLGLLLCDRALNFRRSRPLVEYYPTVSVVISALNEEKAIGRRIRNLLEQEYPANKLEIIIASDGSTDATVEQARAVADDRIKVLAFEQNRGKSTTLNDAVSHASGEILLFSDAETEFDKDFVLQAVKPFSDSTFGCGSGELYFRHETDLGRSENFYWTFEKKLRSIASRLGILPFASGGCVLVRRELFEPLPVKGDVDRALPLSAIRRGYRVFYESHARAYDRAADDAAFLFNKRARTALRGTTDFFAYLPELARAGKWLHIFVWVSQRLLRWLVGFFMLTAFLSNAFLVLAGSSPFYKVTLLLQLLFYVCALTGFAVNREGHKTRWISPFLAAYSFSLVNLAFMSGMFRFLKGERLTTWRTRQN